MFSTINIALAAVGRMRDEDNDFIEQLDPVNRLLSAQTIGNVKDVMCELFNEIIEHSRERERAEIPTWVTEVKEFVNEHYADTALDVSALAKHFGINVSYLSRTFKKHTDIGVLDYIHTVRIDHCKLLLAKNMTVTKVAHLTGYIDSKALIRAFKRYEGITPGQFRP
jgi:YesN/AraC family two-component response regulator